MEMCVISKVISLKMKTLIFAVICTSLNLDHHNEEHAFRLQLSNAEEAAAAAPSDEKGPTVISMEILFCRVFFTL